MFVGQQKLIQISRLRTAFRLCLKFELFISVLTVVDLVCLQQLQKITFARALVSHLFYQQFNILIHLLGLASGTALFRLFRANGIKVG